MNPDIEVTGKQCPLFVSLVDVIFINSAYETAMELRGLLKEKGLDCSETGEGEKNQFYVSDMAERFKDFATAILPGEVKETRKMSERETEKTQL